MNRKYQGSWTVCESNDSVYVVMPSVVNGPTSEAQNRPENENSTRTRKGEPLLEFVSNTKIDRKKDGKLSLV